MATLLVPYNESMKLGDGFNSFTQQLCVDHAVVRADTAEPLKKKETGEAEAAVKDVPQAVTYKTSVIKRISDVTKSLDISAAFSIKYDSVSAKGKGDVINSEQIKDSDLSFMFSVKVVNQVITDHSLTKLAPISGLKPANFSETYGDCFISGFQEGGEFTAIISIKAKDRANRDSIVGEASVAFSKEKLELDGEGKMDKSTNELLQENETTISVSWTGGGQKLKDPGEDWTFETMRAAALKFPELVARTPVRTHAILTKYTSLKSFHSLNAQFSPLNYEHAGVYTQALQEAYLEYKSISKFIQLLSFDVAYGKKTIEPRAKAEQPEGTASADAASGDAASEEKKGAAAEADFVVPNGVEAGTSEVSLNTAEEQGETVIVRKTPAAIQPLLIKQAYAPTLFGLELARTHCRFQMNRIVNEVDNIAKFPELAQQEARPAPYMSPYLFWQLLPVGKAIEPADDHLM